MSAPVPVWPIWSPLPRRPWMLEVLAGPERGLLVRGRGGVVKRFDTAEEAHTYAERRAGIYVPEPPAP